MELPIPSRPRNLLPNTPIPVQAWLTYDPYKGFQDPLDYAWNLAVEQQVSSSFSMRIAYVATHGSHEWQDLELNPDRCRNARFNPGRVCGYE